MKATLLLTAVAVIIGLGLAWTSGTADAGIMPSAACPFADSETDTECVISSDWGVGAGGSPANKFPDPPGLPGPYEFHKTLHITGSGNIDTRPPNAAPNNEITEGITIEIDGTMEVAGMGGAGGAFLMDSAASLINANDPAAPDPANNSAGPIIVTATAGATLQSGSIIKAQNTRAGGAGGAITLKFGASSLFAGSITSQALTGTTGNSGGDIDVEVTGDLVMAGGSINSEKQANGGSGGDIHIDVTGSMTMQGTPGAEITSAHPAATNGAPGGDITIGVGGNMVMGPGTLIDSTSSGEGGNIAITVAGDMTMQGPATGAAIKSRGNPGGNITIAVGTGDLGIFTMESGTLIDSGGPARAGNIKITAGKEVHVQQGARVLAGQRSEQNTQGHGGRIFVIAGCLTNIFGTLSSQGQDPGADLVHVEGCEVHIGPQGLVESTASAHAPGVPTSCDGIDDPEFPGNSNEPGGDAGEVLRGDHPATSSVCVEIWGRHITIDQGGQVNADFSLSGDIQGHGWIDIFAEQDITINGTAAAPAPFAVHSNAMLGNDIGGDVRVMAKLAFVTLTDRALQASATANGSAGGHVTVEAAGLIKLDGSTLEAAGDNFAAIINNPPPCDPPPPGQGSTCGKGGFIEVRSHQGAVSWLGGTGNVNPDIGDSPPAGEITLTACTTVTATANFDDASPIISQGALCADSPAIPECMAPPPCDTSHYVIFNPGGRWDRCGESTISGHKFDTDSGLPLAGWTIHITGPGVNLLTVTDQSGLYTFTVPGGQTYLICEVLLDNTWTETSPTGPASATVQPCSPGEAPWGHQVSLNEGGACCNGQTVTDKDFYNEERPTIECPEDLPRGPLMTRTVNPGKPLGGGGVAGNPENYHTLQDAYLEAKASPNTKDEVIGMFSKTTENVVLDTYYSKTMTITQCTSAQITAANNTLPVWTLKSTRKLLIIGPDSVAGTIGWYIETGTHELKSIRSNGASVAGVRIMTNSNKVSFNNVASNGIGVDILGNTNTLTSGTIGPNSGNGIHIGPGKTGNNISGATIQYNSGNGILVEGYTNTIKSNKFKYNSPSGLAVTGNTNTLQSNQSDENAGDGYNIGGTNNVVKDNKANKNTQDGFELKGTGQKLTGSASSQTTIDYRIETTGAVSAPSSNKADGNSIPTAGKCTGFFTNPAVLTCN